MEVKVCNTCVIERSTSEFYFRKDSGKYQNKCKPCTLIKSSKYRKENRETIRKRDRLYYANNIEKHKIKNKIFKENNREHLREYLRNYRNNRNKTDPLFKLANNLRGRLNKAISGGYKSGSAVDDLGCSIKFLKQYLEEQFYPRFKTGEDMTWDNWARNGWHIDHILPLSKFNLCDYAQLKQACHYTNLQPLWSEENLAKKDKIQFKME